MRLPVLKPDRVSSRTPATDDGPAAASVKRRILIVDDNHDSAMSLGMMLKLLGNETHSAHDGLAAVTAADQLRPDIILLDIGLPKLNGHDACRRIREQPWSNGTVIVALTGWGQEEDRRRSQEAGFNHHLYAKAAIRQLWEEASKPTLRQIAPGTRWPRQYMRKRSPSRSTVPYLRRLPATTIC